MNTDDGTTASRQALAARRAARRRVQARAEALARDGTVPVARELPVILLPANTRPLAPLDARAREAFRERLRATLREASAETRRETASGSTREVPAETRDVPAETREVPDAARPAARHAARHAACCAVCEGACCLAAGTRAHLDAATLQRVRRRQRQAHLPADDAALEALYAAYLPAVHVADSCVCHGEAGCTLPRSLRSDLCNRYQCGALTQLDRALAATGGDAVFVVATDDVAVRRAAIVSSEMTQVVPLPPDAGA